MFPFPNFSGMGARSDFLTNPSNTAQASHMNLTPTATTAPRNVVVVLFLLTLETGVAFSHEPAVPFQSAVPYRTRK